MFSLALVNAAAGAPWLGRIDSAGFPAVVNPATGQAIPFGGLMNQPCTALAVSADGNWAAVITAATNLVSGVEAYHGPQLYLYNRVNATWTLVSRDYTTNAPAGAAGPVFISQDGGLVFFETGPWFPQTGRLAAGLKDYVGPVKFDRVANTFTAVSPDTMTALNGGAASVTRVVRVAPQATAVVVASTSTALGATSLDKPDLISQPLPTGTPTRLGPVEETATVFNYETWRTTEAGFTSAQLSDPLLSGPKGDPDGDGIVNRLEFLMGTSPVEFDAATVRLEMSGSELAANFPLSFRTTTGELNLLFTENLTSAWTSVDASSVADGTFTSGDGAVLWKAHKSLLTAPTRARFFRLSSELP